MPRPHRHPKVTVWKRIARLTRYIDRAWFLPALGLLVASDSFIGVVPTDGLLVLACIARPKRWGRITAMIALGSAIGTTTLCGFASAWSGHFLHELRDYPRTVSFLRDYGDWAIFLNAIGPIPISPLAIIAGLVKTPIHHVFWMTLLARGLKYGFFGWLSVKAPHLLRRFRIFHDEAQAIGKPRDRGPT